MADDDEKMVIIEQACPTYGGSGKILPQ